MSSDFITILRALSGRRMCKTITPDGIVPYDDAARFDASRQQVDGIGDLYEALLELAGDRAACVVRGGLIDPHNNRGIRRRLHGDDATLLEFPRRWVALDIDGVELPPGIAAQDLWGCADAVVQRLPQEFARAACVVQATASHGIKPGAHLRLWYWLDRALTGAELKMWLRSAPTDHALFNAVQIHYTAAPRFIGMPDPLPERVVIRSEVQAAVAPPPIALPKPWVGTRGRSMAKGGALSIMCRAATRITCAEPGERHRAAVAAALAFAELVRRGTLDTEDAAEVICAALHEAGKPEHEAVVEASGLIRWALSMKEAEVEAERTINTASGDFMREAGQ